MKKLWSVLTKTHNFHLSKHLVIPVNSLHICLFIAAILALLIIKACAPQPSIDTIATTKSASKQQKIAEIEDSINNSYARLAAQHADICPKLLQKEVDKDTIERVAEVMVDEYCDYFLYPRTGQQIAVTVNNSQIEALLIVPVLHDFANGGYQAASYDKHVIRLSYNGATYKPERLSYDVAISVND